MLTELQAGSGEDSAEDVLEVSAPPPFTDAAARRRAQQQRGRAAQQPPPQRQLQRGPGAARGSVADLLEGVHADRSSVELSQGEEEDEVEVLSAGFQ